MPFVGTPYWAMSAEVKARTQRKISEGRLRGNNPNWKGDLVGYAGLHDWVKDHIGNKPLLCERCNTKRALDLANKSGTYLRDLNDWWWLCRRCHMELDGRLKNLEHDKTGWLQKCKYCDKEFWTIPYRWNQGWGRFCSKRCSNKYHGLPRKRQVRNSALSQVW